MAGILAVVEFVRYMIEDEAFKAMNTQGLNMWSPFGGDIASTVLSMVLIWFTTSALLTIVSDAFFDSRLLRHMSLFFGTPVLILDVCFFTTYITGIVGADPYESGDVRILLSAIVIGIALALVLSRVVEDGKDNLPTVKETKRCLLLLPPELIAVIPLTLRGCWSETRLPPRRWSLRSFPSSIE